MKILYSNTRLRDIPNDFVLNNIDSSLIKNPNSTIKDLIFYDDNIVRLLVFPSDLNNETLEVIENTIDELELETNVTGV